MKRTFSRLAAIFLLAAAVSCGGGGDNKNAGAPAPANTAPANSAAPAASLKPGEIPFPGFPTVATTAKAGETVLCPSHNWITDAVSKGADKVTFIFYDQKMIAPGDVESEVEFLGPGKQKVPNAYIVPIPAGQSAAVGDIVLTWWQSGSGMNRAIVVDAANPKEPVVRYLDIDYDNPAKSRDGKTTIGQMDEQLKPDTFVKIAAPMDPGTAVAIKDAAGHEHARVIRVAGDKVFVLGFAGHMKVVNKADCVGLPLVPGVKAGDTVKVPFTNNFTDATVTRVDPKIGRVFVTVESTKKESAVAFGDVFVP